MKTTQERIFQLLIIVCTVQILFYASILPASLASHFSRDGEPNGWSSRTTFFGLYLGILVMVLLFFRILPGLLSRFPNTMINLPHKDYWLDPSRRDVTFSGIKDRIVSMGNGFLAFLIVTFQLVIQANLAEGIRLNSKELWILLAVFVVFTLSWIVRFIRVFRMPGGQGS